MVHPYRIRNKESIIYNLQQGRLVLGFAETVDDFMNQFYKFKSYLIRIDFLQRDSHFAFNLSNISNHTIEKRKSRFIGVNTEIMHQIFEFFDKSDLLYLNALSKDFYNASKLYWPVKASNYQWKISNIITESSQSHLLINVPSIL